MPHESNLLEHQPGYETAPKKIGRRIKNIFSGKNSEVASEKKEKKTFSKLRYYVSAGILLVYCGFNVFKYEDTTKLPNEISSVISAEHTPTQTKTPVPLREVFPTLTPTPVLVERFADIREIYQFENVELFIDQYKIPLGYKINSPAKDTSGSIIFFSDEQRAVFSTAYEKSQGSKNDEFIPIELDDETSSQSLWDLTPPQPETLENPRVLKKPADTLSSEELATLGVEIFDSGADEPQLSIRKSAFEEGGIFQALTLLNEGENDPTKKISLDIFLLNSPLFSNTALTKEQEQRLDPKVLENFKRDSNKLNIALGAARSKMITKLEVYIQDYERLIPKIENEEFKLLQKNNLVETQKMLFFINSLSNEEFFLRYKSQITEDLPSTTLGTYFTLGNKNLSTIIITAGDGGVRAKDKIFFKYTAEGKIEISKINTLLFNDDPIDMGILPQEDKSFPRDEDFPLKTDSSYANGNYLIEKYDIGIALRHEIMHAWLINWLIKLQVQNKLDKVDWFLNLSSGIDPNNNPITFKTVNEYATDEMALRTIKLAEEWYEEEKNDKGYSLLFSIPKNRNNPHGGFMLSHSSKKKV